MIPVLGQTWCSICDCRVTLTTSMGVAMKTVGKVARKPAPSVDQKCGSAESRSEWPNSCSVWPYIPKKMEFITPNDTRGHDSPRKKPWL